MAPGNCCFPGPDTARAVETRRAAKWHHNGIPNVIDVFPPDDLQRHLRPHGR